MELVVGLVVLAVLLLVLGAVDGGAQQPQGAVVINVGNPQVDGSGAGWAFLALLGVVGVLVAVLAV